MSLRECDKCGSDSVVSAKEARAVFRRYDGGTLQSLEESGRNPTHICTNCHAKKSVPGVN